MKHIEIILINGQGVNAWYKDLGEEEYSRLLDWLRKPTDTYTIRINEKKRTTIYAKSLVYFNEIE